MRLTRLTLSGFKSFADTIQLPFEEGVTAIVGPNGCGKSNISDAVRWVLGEQRTRMLRSARMDEVIFHGSAKRRPINIAEVSLHFDNDDGTLPVAYQEVVITRRLSRSGQSEYLLNRAPVRLKDIQDLLRGTGLGSFAGVVIEAQMIDSLLSDRTEERRSLFEEAAGIGLFRDRKTTTERRLEKTREDLQRLDDVIGEVQTQVRSLARQRGRADRHHQFTDRRFALVMTLVRRDIARFDETAADLQRRWGEVSDRLPTVRERLAAGERERESRVQERATAETRRTELERRLAQCRVEVEKLEGDLNLARERLANAAARRERARAEREHARGRAQQAERERAAAAEERQAAASARQSVQTELNLRTASEDEARTRLARQRDRVREHEATLQQRAEAHRALAGERAAIERELEDLRNQALAADGRQQATAEALGRARDQLAAAREALDRREEEDRQAAGESERARHELASAREHEAATLTQRRTAEEGLAQLTARRAALENLERDRAGLAPAVRTLLDARQQFGDGAVLGPLSDFLRPSHEGARLTERVLGEWLQAVLVRDESVVDAVRQWHAEARPGPLLLLPVDPGPAHRDGDEAAALLVDAGEPAGAWARALLAGNVSLDPDARAIRRGNGAVFLSGAEDRTGPLMRRAELESLTTRVDEAERRVAELAGAAQAASAAHEEAERALAAATENADRGRRVLQETRGAFEEAERDAGRRQRDQSDVEAVWARITERIGACTERLGDVEEELRRLEGRRRQSETELGNERGLLANLESEQEAERERRVHWQVEEAQVSARETAAREREDRAEATWREAREEMTRLERELEEIESSTTDVDHQQAEWGDRLAERRVEMAELETATAAAERSVEESQHALSASESTLTAARSTVERLSDELHRLELERTEARGRRQALVERVEAEWHKPLAQLLGTAPDVDGDPDELRAEADELARTIEALGPVNPLAAHEHEEERQRLEFLQTQRADLVEARESLHQALREIGETAEQMFQETFTLIRAHFRRVFHTLFEGGECDVRLVDEHDPLNSEIEIRAAPRGKRTQRIHLLSSGERALVAISLLFAIYLAKPSPFCLLDEVDAPLDDANVQRFVHLLDEFKGSTQFIVITHNPRTMQVADDVYGVTMQEPGVSTIVGVRLGRHEAA